MSSEEQVEATTEAGAATAGALEATAEAGAATTGAVAVEAAPEVRRRRKNRGWHLTAERKQVFLETFVRTGDKIAGLDAVGVSRWTLSRWRLDDEAFRKLFNEAKQMVDARAAAAAAPTPPPSVTVGERKRLFFDEFARVGTVTGACDRAGVTLQKFEQWTKSSKRFRARYEEAKLRFHDRIEQKIMEQINKGKNVGLLRFKAQGELPEKYGRAGKQTPAKGKSGMTWDDLERIVEESNDEATRH